VEEVGALSESCGLARLNVIVIAWWRVVVSVHLVSVLIKHRDVRHEGGAAAVIDGGDDVVVVKAKQNLRASPWRSTDLISR